jgi:Mycotoxin biosynthesis protein UstYa
MSVSIPWRGFSLISTIIFILYLVFQTVFIIDLAPIDYIPSDPGSAKSSIQDLFVKPESTTPQKFSGSLEENDGWATRPLSEKGGLLWVQYNETFEVTWGISMFHGLHCIEMLRMALAGGPMAHSAMEESSTAPEENGRDANHLSHCLDYIAQVSHNSISIEYTADGSTSFSHSSAVGIIH